MGSQSEKLVKEVRNSVANTFYSVNFRIVFGTRTMLSTNTKDTLPTHSKSHVVYQFKCKRCESVYIGRCYRRLSDRISEHVPSVIRRNAVNKKNEESFSQSEEGIRKMLKHYRLRATPEIVQPAGIMLPKVSKSSIGSHLIENPACGHSYDPSCFTILANGRSKYHVDVLEGVFINSEKPVLCRQKEFVYAVKLF